jgi:hypothetical protein
MRRRFLWLVALAGVVWLYLRRGVRRPQPVVQIPPPSDPAEELRRKLERTKERDETTVAPEPAGEHEAQAETSDPASPVISEELDARRREVHDRARSAADEMRRTSSD